jgi:RNA polymerase sigma factor (sigma-70 family)
MTPKKKSIDLDSMIREFRPKISFKVQRALGPRNPDWEDITDEILTQAVENVRTGAFRGESTIGTFIFTITVRRIADYIRQKTRVLRFVPEPVMPEAPIEELERGESIERMVAAMGSLKPKYREVLRLYFFMECTREETARRLGVSPAKVSERVNYAQKLLRQKLEK